MTNIIPFEAKLPAYLKTKTQNEFGTISVSFPYISIKGKTFTLRRGDEKELIMKDDAPAPYIDVVILKVWPTGNDHAKTWYAEAFTEGSDAKPTCYSNNGKYPSTFAENPQAKSCAVCPHNQWGSRITPDGKKLKECQDSKRLAVAIADKLDDPMLLRVPAASLKPLGQYGNLLASREVAYYGVVTRIGFDYTVAHPQLTFKPVGILPESLFKEAEKIRNSDVVAAICGIREEVVQEEFKEEPPQEKNKPSLEEDLLAAIEKLGFDD